MFRFLQDDIVFNTNFNIKALTLEPFIAINSKVFLQKRIHLPSKSNMCNPEISLHDYNSCTALEKNINMSCLPPQLSAINKKKLPPCSNTTQMHQIITEVVKRHVV
jgi:hypothetical protein